MVDWARVEELRDEVGADAFGEVVELFLAEAGTAVDALRGGGPADEESLHFLKSSAVTLGFSSFAALCAEGERAAASGRARDVDTGAIAACFDASLAAFLADPRIACLGVSPPAAPQITNSASISSSVMSE